MNIAALISEMCIRDRQRNGLFSPADKMTFCFSYLSVIKTGCYPQSKFLTHIFMRPVSYTHLDVYKRQDVFRQPKYAYYMFKAQRSPEKQDRLFETGPMVYLSLIHI